MSPAVLTPDRSIPGRTDSARGSASEPCIDQQPSLSGIRAERSLDPSTFSALRRRTVLEGCKWDPQVGDVATLAPFSLVLSRRTWATLANQAELLSAESMAAEQEILRRPELLRELGLPRALRNALQGTAPLTPAAVRVIRFDFHLTTKGWRISEANSDVPGGFSEASHFTGLMGKHYPQLRPAGDPGKAWADAISASTGQGGVIGLLSAPGYMEDHQVISFLAAQLRELGFRAYLAKPEQISWPGGCARIEAACFRGRVDALVRFYQAEWLARLNERCDWSRFFRGGQTPVANPGLAAITESKRLPLIWNKLSSPLPTWRVLLPETRDPRAAPWDRDDGWLLKTAMCNTGDTVCVREWLAKREWSRARRAARWFPGRWVAQRRFESVSVLTPMGPRHVCLGVYTVNGKAAGVYARLALKPLIDFAATDVALLLEAGHG